MAKKNSTKTATKEAMSNSTPRTITFNKWAGINLEGVPLDTGVEDYTSRASKDSWSGREQSDAPTNYLAMQNNLVCGFNGSLESRHETIELNKAGENGMDGDYEISDTAVCYKNYVYCAARSKHGNYDKLYRFLMPKTTDFVNNKWRKNPWEEIELIDNETDAKKVTRRTITAITVFASKLIVLCQTINPERDINEYGEMFEGDLETCTENGVENARYISEPDTAPTLVGHNVTLSETTGVTRLRFKYVYCNKYGSTTESPTITRYADVSPKEYQSSKYISILGPVPKDAGITGVDIYCTQNDNQEYIFCGHCDVEENSETFEYNWLGAQADITQWSTSSLIVPAINTTSGVNATHIDQYDGRLYFYGGSEKYRLFLGGNPGSELSVATGLGGAFIDVEPGSGQEIKKVLKFKTYNGATVITILTYHPNTTRSSRYNILESTITLTNEYSTKGYEYEKVDSVPGCSSFYGADTFIDGLYTVNRYGIAFTTKAQENSNNLRAMYCSDAIKPLFDSLLGNQIEESRMLCIGDVVYIMLANELDALDSSPLSDILLCYNTTTKAWYTYSIFESGQENAFPGQQLVRHMIHIDYSGFWEGLGIITNKGVYLVPTTGDDYNLYFKATTKEPLEGHPSYAISAFTHELSMRTPITNAFKARQLQLYFDYVCAPEGFTIWVEGVDIYGQFFKDSLDIVEPTLRRMTTYYMIIDRNVRSLRLFIKGKAYFRLTHINMECFQKSTMGLHYGFDTEHVWEDELGNEGLQHNKVESYNDLREILMV